MANRYWVGGSDNWDATAGTKWALTSGGAGGQAVPTTSDDVFFDANSGAVTVIISSPATTKNLDFSGYTGTLQISNGVNISGDLTLVSAMTLTSGSTLTFSATSGTKTITSNGKSITGNSININGAGGTFQLADNLTCSIFTLTAGSFNLNNKNITSTSMGSSNINTRSLTMGSGTWSITGTGTIWNFATTTGLTFNAGTSTIKSISTNNTALTFTGGNQIFNNLWFARGASTATLTILGANTFNDIKDDGTGAHAINFPAGNTQTVSSFNISGTAPNLITITSATSGSTFTFTDATGITSVDYLSLRDSIATGGAIWYAGANSVNVSGNSGWIFSAPPSANPGGFFLFF